MSKVLEDFKIVKFKTINAGYDYGYKIWDEIEQALLNAQKLEEENDNLYVELTFADKQNKELTEDLKQLKKKLEIIFNKNVNTMFLTFAKTYKEYNDRLLGIDPNLPTEVYFLTEEEFDILKK